MIFSELVDLVLLAVNGGDFVPEAAVLRPEVESFVPAAAHKVIRNEIFRLKQEARADKNASGIAKTAVDSGFYVSYTLSTKSDLVRGIKYVELPGVLLSLPVISPLESVFPPKAPQNQFTIISGPSAIMEGFEGVLVQAWEENVGGVSRVFLHGIQEDACDVIVRAAVEVSSMLGDLPLPVPVGLEYDIIQLCIAHFRGQRAAPADVIVDNKDVNAQ